LCRCCKTEKHQKQLDVLEMGAEKVEADFDIHTIIMANKEIRQ
jgi:hypothetical protein